MPARRPRDARSALERSNADVAAYEHLLGNTQGHDVCAGERDSFVDWRPEGPGSADDLNRAYRTDIKISLVYAATRFARAVMEPGRAVIVQIERVSAAAAVVVVSVMSSSGRVGGMDWVALLRL